MPRRTRIRWLAALALGALLVLPPADSGGDPERRAAELVKQLNAPDFVTRENATDELRAIGEKAIGPVVDASNSSDPETRARARWLLPILLRAAGTSKVTGIELNAVRVQEFQMGSPKGEAGRRADEEPHAVRLTRTFLLGTTEVTQEQYRTVTRADPSWFAATGGGKDKVKGLNTDKFPVEQVTWFDALDFCNRLSKIDGFEPYYKFADEKREGGSLKSATVTVLGGSGYRLPTEAEWEYACRCTTDTAFYFGRRVVSGREGNFRSQFTGGYGGDTIISLGRTTTVGAYPRTRWGHHDLHGNVAEWCWDWYDKDYHLNAPQVNPTGPEKGAHRVVRGGSWLVDGSACRSAARGSHPPGDANYTTGFRVARSPY